MAAHQKGRSPFYPGQPVPVELFVGRAAQIERIMTRGVGQVERGKPAALYIQGEYGIGKSSIAGLVQTLAEKEHGLHAIYAPLGGARTINDVAAAILQATVRSGAFDPTRVEKVREWLSKYIGRQELFGLSLNLDELRKDAAQLANPFGLLSFLGEVRNRLHDTGVKGIVLTLDEINGITADPQFAHFIKGLVDTNAMSPEPLPVLLILCGIEERRREMVERHPPIARIFDVIEIEPLREAEVEHFFRVAFESVQMSTKPEAMWLLIHYSAGFPKLMHLIGDAAYWLDQDGVLDMEEAATAVLRAAEDVGRKLVDQQVYKALRSEDYHSILEKIAKLDPVAMSFTKAQISAVLTDGEKQKLNNFLQKMKRLHVLRPGTTPGEYVFVDRMTRLYIGMNSARGRRVRR